MVNLPVPEVQAGRAMGERGSRSHHHWGSRFGRRRKDEVLLKMEPTSLLELEILARRSVHLMEQYCPKSEHNFTVAMDLLRLQYNLNFMILCERCQGPHNHDEILAPER